MKISEWRVGIIQSIVLDVFVSLKSIVLAILNDDSTRVYL